MQCKQQVMQRSVILLFPGGIRNYTQSPSQLDWELPDLQQAPKITESNAGSILPRDKCCLGAQVLVRRRLEESRPGKMQIDQVAQICAVRSRAADRVL